MFDLGVILDASLGVLGAPVVTTIVTQAIAAAVGVAIVVWGIDEVRHAFKKGR
jgi:DNA-binding transcriptional regulator YbjK